MWQTKIFYIIDGKYTVTEEVIGQICDGIQIMLTIAVNHAFMYMHFTWSLWDGCKSKKKNQRVYIFIIIYYEIESIESNKSAPTPSTHPYQNLPILWEQNYLGVWLYCCLEWTCSSCIPLCWAQSMWTVSGIYILHKPPRIHSSGNIWGFHLLWYRSSEPFLQTPTPCRSKCCLLSSYR